jgi:hypothetical protein
MILQPDHQNLIPSADNLNVNSFHVEIGAIKYFNYKATRIALPGWTVTPDKIPTPYMSFPVSGNHLSPTGTLDITFLIDEDMFNYIILFDWLQGLSLPESAEQYRNLLDGQTERGKGTYTAKETTDITVHLLTNHRNSNILLNISDAFPSSLSGWDMEVSNNASQPITATVSFEFSTINFQIRPNPTHS